MEYIIAGMFICLVLLCLCLYFMFLDFAKRINLKIDRYYHDYVVFKSHFYKFGNYDPDLFKEKI